jgi:amino acid permease
MSSQFQTDNMMERRKMTFPKLLVNLLKLYIGIFMLNTPQGSLRVGIFGALICLFILLCANIFTTYLVIKARNRYKMHDIYNMSQLALVVFGQKTKYFTDFLVLTYGTSSILAYNMYLEKQMK